jgi:DNA-binding transcriptional regulator YhcF (GntR family)
MSLPAQNAAWAAKLPAIEKLVLLCLADHANAYGQCWPSIARIGKRCGVHRSSVMRSLKALEQGGHISIERTFGQQNRYVVQGLDTDTSRTERPVAESDQFLTATGSQLKLVSHDDSTSSTERPDQSHTATPPVAESDPNLLRTYQEPPMNLAKRPRAKGGVRHKMPETPAFHQKVIDAYNELCPDLPQVKSWTDVRRRSLDARIAERVATGRPADTIEYWRSLFESIAANDFLCGRAGGWRANLAWLLKPESFAKTIEGFYDDKRATTNGAQAYG